MRLQKARERLERHAERRDIINDMIENYKDMREELMSGGGIRYDMPKIQASPGDWITRKIIKLADYERAIKKERAKYDRESEALSREIARLENHNEREILIRYYFKNESASNISKALNLNRTSVFRIMRRAESHLDTLPR